jgi:formylglycine-generating enzyme
LRRGATLNTHLSARTAFQLLLFASAAAAGCDSVLGIEEPTPRPPTAGTAGTNAGSGGTTGGGGGGKAGTSAGTSGAAGDPEPGGSSGSGGEAGTGGEPVTAGEAGLGGESAGTGGVTAGNAGAGGSAVECETGTRRCGGKQEKLPELCDDSGQWVADEEENGGNECAALCTQGRCHACATGEKRCNGNVRQECESGSWVDKTLCDDFCRAGECESPPSCSGSLDCGNGVSCCRAFEVEGGTFYRDYDGTNFPYQTYPATITGFILDKFEVTVGRMRRFVDAYSQINFSEGYGKAEHILNDSGWSNQYALPATAEELVQQLQCPDGTYTPASIPGNENKPVNCVSFEVAYAFCLWDAAGRLPTEAEWNYAAAAGAEQREYPWQAPLEEEFPSSEYAYFEQFGGMPTEVGRSTPKGDGRWGHSDLAGNVTEWTLDTFSEYPEECIDCLNAEPTGFRASRGGSYLDYADQLLVGLRWRWYATEASQAFGFRCVHDIQ